MLFFSLTNNLLYFSVTERLIHSNGFEWPLMFFLVVWQVTHDRGHVTPDSWHLTLHTWHVTADTWHVTPDTWFFSLLFLQFFLKIFFYVIATNQTGRKIQWFPYAGLLLLREGCKKKTIESTSILIHPSDPPPYCDHLRLFFFSAVFGLFGMLGTLWNRFCKILVKFEQNKAKQGQHRFNKF